MMTLPEAPETQAYSSTIEAFKGTIRPTRTTLLYRIGLAVVAFAVYIIGGIATFLGGGLDPKRMAAAVEPSLYRQRRKSPG